jgi:UDP-glucose:(galactosyl)LPS alpha-1,2-glucosyltransferase
LFNKIKRTFIGFMRLIGIPKYCATKIAAQLFFPKISDAVTLPLIKTKVNVAFCFNQALVKQVAVVIHSLISVSKKRCDYNFCCVIDNSVSEQDKKLIEKFVNNTGSEITFFYANNDFDGAYLGNWSLAIYYRMMLPKLLKNLDYVIYADIDVIFCNDLVEASQIDMGDNLIAGVRDSEKDPTHINSGFLILNLKKIREEDIYDKWIYMAKNTQNKYPDQTVLSETCKNRILYLPLKYNFCSMRSWFNFAGKNVYSDAESHDLKYHMVMIHFAGKYKPWQGDKDIHSYIWWKYAKETGLFNN